MKADFKMRRPLGPAADVGLPGPVLRWSRGWRGLVVVVVVMLLGWFGGRMARGQTATYIVALTNTAAAQGGFATGQAIQDLSDRIDARQLSLAADAYDTGVALNSKGTQILQMNAQQLLEFNRSFGSWNYDSNGYLMAPILVENSVPNLNYRAVTNLEAINQSLSSNLTFTINATNLSLVMTNFPGFETNAPVLLRLEDILRGETNTLAMMEAHWAAIYASQTNGVGKMLTDTNYTVQGGQWSDRLASNLVVMTEGLTNAAAGWGRETTNAIGGLQRSAETNSAAAVAAVTNGFVGLTNLLNIFLPGNAERAAGVPSNLVGFAETQRGPLGTFSNRLVTATGDGPAWARGQVSAASRSNLYVREDWVWDYDLTGLGAAPVLGSNVSGTVSVFLGDHPQGEKIAAFIRWSIYMMAIGLFIFWWYKIWPSIIWDLQSLSQMHTIDFKALGWSTTGLAVVAVYIAEYWVALLVMITIMIASAVCVWEHMPADFIGGMLEAAGGSGSKEARMTVGLSYQFVPWYELSELLVCWVTAWVEVHIALWICKSIQNSTPVMS